MSETESSSAEAPVAETELDVEADAQVEDQAEETSEEGDEPEPEEDTEEVEYEGKTFSAPKGIKDALLRQADYTRKTQEVAEFRKTLESRHAEINQLHEAQAQTFEQRVQLAQFDAALEQYANLDWSAYADQHGDRAAITAQAQWRQLEAARGLLQKEITDKESEHRLVSERTTASALEEANKVLAREVEGFGPQLVSDVVKAAGAYGFTPEELRDSFVGADGAADIRTFKLLARLATLEATVAKTQVQQKKAQTAEKVAAVKPAVTVKANAGQYKPGLSDDLPADEWLRRRNAEAAKAQARPRFAR